MMINAADNNVISIEQKKRLSLQAHTDDELMQLAQADVKEAFSELVRRYAPLVRGYCRKWNRDRGDDLAQDVFLRLWRSRERYRPRNEFKAYLFMILVNRCRNEKRTLGRCPPLEPYTPEKSDKTVSADQLERILAREQAARVHRLIQKLSPKLKEAVLLRYMSELSYPKISEIIKVNEATVRSRVLLGIQRLRKEL